MNSESERYWRLLERRLSLLDALTKTLAESRADFIALDLEAMRGRIREQEQFCGQIRALDHDASLDPRLAANVVISAPSSPGSSVCNRFRRA